MLRKFFRDSSRRNRTKKKSQIRRMSPLASLLAAGLGSAALAVAQSNPYPTYVTGPQPNGSWVVSSGQVITPAGTQVNLGIRVRAKAIALNPNYASARQWLSNCYVQEGRMDEALREARLAAELDPYAPRVVGNYALYLAGAERRAASRAPTCRAAPPRCGARTT